MRIASIATSRPECPPGGLPLALEQNSSRASSLLKLAIVVPAAGALLYPFLLVAWYAASNPEMRAALYASPAASLPILVAVAFWLVLFAWPLKRIVDSLWRGRSITIAEDHVQVEEMSLFGREHWREPLSSYLGIAHHIRTSLSEVRHELILVHPIRDRSVLVAMAPRFSKEDIERIAGLIGLSEIPTRELYRTRRSMEPAGEQHATLARPLEA